MFYILLDIDYEFYLSKLREKRVHNSIERVVASITDAGGEVIKTSPYIFRFSSIFQESAKKVAQLAIHIRNECSQKESGLLGTTIIVTRTDKNISMDADQITGLTLQAFEENQVWIDNASFSLFESFVEASNGGILKKVVGLKAEKASVNHIYSLVMARPEKIRIIENFFLKKRSINGKRYNSLFLRGSQGWSEEFNLAQALRKFNYRTIALNGQEWGTKYVPILPFIKTIDSSLLEESLSALSGSDERALKKYASFMEGLIREDRVTIFPDHLMKEFQRAYTVYLRGYSAVCAIENKIPIYIIYYPSQMPESVIEILKTVLFPFIYLGKIVPVFIDRERHWIDNFQNFSIQTVSFKPFQEREVNSLIKEYEKLGTLLGCEFSYIPREMEAEDLFFSLISSNSSLKNPQRHFLKWLPALSVEILYLVTVAGDLLGEEDLITIFQRDAVEVKESIRWLMMIRIVFKRDNYYTSRDPKMEPVLITYLDQDTQKTLNRETAKLLISSLKSRKAAHVFPIFYYIYHYGGAEQFLKVLVRLFDFYIALGDYRGKPLFQSPLFKRKQFSEPFYHSLYNIIYGATLSYFSLKMSLPEVKRATFRNKQIIAPPEGGYTEYKSLMLGGYHYAIGNAKESIEYVKKAIFDFQKSQDIAGICRGNIFLGLNYLLHDKITTCLNLFEAAEWNASKASLYDLKAKCSLLKSSASFIYGNLSKTLKTIEDLYPVLKRVWRANYLFFAYFLKGRSLLLLGDYKNSSIAFQEGAILADYYKEKGVIRLFNVWRGYALAVEPELRDEGIELLGYYQQDREALYFLAELSVQEKKYEQAISYLEQSLKCPVHPPSFFTGEHFPLQNGYSALEDMTISPAKRDSGGVLQNRIAALYYYTLGELRNRSAGIKKLSQFCTSERLTRMEPFDYSYHYYLYLLHKKDIEKARYYLNQAFRKLQERASHFDDQKLKRDYLNKYYLHREILEAVSKQTGKEKNV